MGPQQQPPHQGPPAEPVHDWTLGPSAIPGAVLAQLGVVVSVIGLLAPWWSKPARSYNGIGHVEYLMGFNPFLGGLLMVGIVVSGICAFLVLTATILFLAQKSPGYKAMALVPAIIGLLIGMIIPLYFVLDGSGHMAGPATWAYGFAFVLCIIGAAMLTRRPAL
ncbi:hypothetical protein [Enemella sp. A6]|uniref:hypothetical protein n=1 Tax=Enemella sp. A6 TaxID=3440152 RepID=UPI003EB81EF7